MMKETIERLIEKIGFTNKNLKLRQITVGASGSEVYELVNDSEIMILKMIDFKSADSGQIQTFMKEWDFYNKIKGRKIPFIPKIYQLYKNDEYALILMKAYDSIKHKEWNEELQDKVLDLIINVHMLPMNLITEQENVKEPEQQDNPVFYYEEWSKLLNEYQESFDTESLESIFHNFEKIKNINVVLPECLIHGDFHLNNILYDKENKSLILCDWQNVGSGNGCDDISFFVSRGNSDGMNLDDTILMEQYCEKYSCLSGNKIKFSDVLTQNAKQTVMVSFMCWHYYLHGAEYERVKQIFDQMVKSFQYLKENVIE